MKNTALVLLIALLGVGCKSAKVVGDTVYHRVSWPSGFGSYQHIIVVYPMGKTNLQQVLTTDSVPGPVPSMFNASVSGAAYVIGAHQMRNVGRSKNKTSVNVSNTGSSSAEGGVGDVRAYGGDGGDAASSATGGNVGDISTGGGTQGDITVNQTVNAPGSHPGGSDNHKP